MSHRIQQSLIVPAELGEQRLDMAASELMPEYSRSRIQSWIKQGALRVNGKQVKPKEKVIEGDQVELDVELEAQGDWEAQPIALDIVFEDEHLLVINKQADFVVHPAAGHSDGTVVNAVLHHCPALAELPRAGIVHRLDKDTTGLMVIAKTLVAHSSLVEQLQAREMGREYETVVYGELTGGGMVDAAIGRHPQSRQKMAVTRGGKDAVTHYRLIRRWRGFTHLRLKLETGRTHQIRVHMAHINHSILGDPLYGSRPRLPKGLSSETIDYLRSFGRQALHAKALELSHPTTGEVLSWEVDLPEDMISLLNRLDREEEDAL
ncbi:23S rRNA pseudouridine(1911/1915/1917) synthase RluD [Hahella sp. KA22]|uniref:23S rRNA pseudouridine(1911/1915/1917) synthase RluD n=1 Tax=Hahella sp. KA22 TaxID=1628392 RepID=UPI000FDCF479|nr:23S rRNA pseudouridine(1911/1915/1917) synthase RluD [Hahella sp. KA22]AZZ94355.1 23S rRNA pseudouridine(1911/1915/1917) synthase RluD [Hahella sp. KA22]QAY57729.1 23S rRNA pseudouridine(1911/1915/1917) synthase RluD [Hahella sp. KA22]